MHIEDYVSCLALPNPQSIAAKHIISMYYSRKSGYLAGTLTR